MTDEKYTATDIIDWNTYMHIFFLFPVLIYVLITCVSDRRASPRTKIFLVVAVIIIMLSHMQNAMWLNPHPSFFKKNNNIVSAFKSAPQLQIILYLLLSIPIYYIIFN